MPNRSRVSAAVAMNGATCVPQGFSSGPLMAVTPRSSAQGQQPLGSHNALQDASARPGTLLTPLRMQHIVGFHAFSTRGVTGLPK